MKIIYYGGCHYYHMLIWPWIAQVSVGGGMVQCSTSNKNRCSSRWLWYHMQNTNKASVMSKCYLLWKLNDAKHITVTCCYIMCTGWSSVHWNATGMPLECHWLIHCTLGYHWATQRILAGYTATPLENLVKTDHTGMPLEKLTFAAYTWTPLEGLWQPTHAPTHIVKHAK